MLLLLLLLSLLELQLLLEKKKKRREKKKRKENNFPSVFCLPLYCSKTSPNRPVAPPHPSPPLLLPPFLSFFLLLSTGLHTSLHSGSCRVPAAQDLKKIKLRESHCRTPRLPSSHLLSPLIDYPFAFALPSLSFPSSSLSSCV